MIIIGFAIGALIGILLGALVSAFFIRGACGLYNVLAPRVSMRGDVGIPTIGEALEVAGIAWTAQMVLGTVLAVFFLLAFSREQASDVFFYGNLLAIPIGLLIYAAALKTKLEATFAQSLAIAAILYGLIIGMTGLIVLMVAFGT